MTHASTDQTEESPLVFIHNDMALIARCGCGWQGATRLWIEDAQRDAVAHAEETGHGMDPCDPWMVPSETSR